MEEIIEMRGYAKAKDLYDNAKSAQSVKALPQHPLIDLVKRVEFDLVQQEINGRTADN